MNDSPSNSNSEIWQAFGLNPPADDLPGTIPRNMIFQTSPENLIKAKKLSAGDQIAGGIRVFWDNTRAKCDFQSEGRDLNFSFKAPPGDYLSISWALGDFEIDQLSSMHLISVSAQDIISPAGKPLQNKIYGKLAFVKNTFEVSYETIGDRYRNRMIIGFSLENEDIQFSTAHRMWIDFLISRPKSQFTIRDPRLIVQKRILI